MALFTHVLFLILLLHDGTHAGKLIPLHVCLSSGVTLNHADLYESLCLWNRSHKHEMGGVAVLWSH